MASFIRNALSGPSRLPQSSRILPNRAPLVSPGPRYLSTTPRLLAPEPQPSRPSSAFGSSPTPRPSTNPFANFRFNLPPPRTTSKDPDDWWKALSRPREYGHVSTASTSRSFAVRRSGKVDVTFKLLNRLIRDTKMKIKVRNSEFHEGNSAKRRRLRSQRHKRRFAAMVREKVKEVNLWQQRR